MSVCCTLTTVWLNQASSDFSLVIPRLSVMLPCLMREGRRCTKSLIPPSGYSSTSTWAENPLTCVKKPSCRVSAGIVTVKYLAWVTGGLASVTLDGALAGAVIGVSLRVVDDQMAHLLALGEQIALETVEEVVVQLLALLLLFFGAGCGGVGAAGVGLVLLRGGGLVRGRRFADLARDRDRGLANSGRHAAGSGEVHGS